ncbi:MAG TPA: DUF4012 domain-containing protein [Patescibacteria group bacterium]|jgi:hypothetical protein
MTEQSELPQQPSPPATPTKSNLLTRIFNRPVTTTPTPAKNLTEQQLKRQKIKRILLIAGLVLLGLVGLMAGYTIIIARQLKVEIQATSVHARGALDAFKTQNLPVAEQELLTLETTVDQVQKTYRRLGFYNLVPILRGWYQDGQHSLNALQFGTKAALQVSQEITPYADVLGFQGEDSFAGGTAENRIKIIIETLDKVMPAFDQIAQNLESMRTEVLAINPQHYPESFRDLQLRAQIIKTQETVNNSVSGFISFRPVLEQLPDIAGGKGERKKYLILFQNDNELRPTGGFLTAYAVVFVEDGKVTPEKSDDIYELDQRFTGRIPIPTALGKYLTTERFWNLRDMNIHPDFRLSMDQFFEHYQTVRGEPGDIDGIIAVDTEVLSSLLRILGPVAIPGYGTFSAEPDERCDGCAQVVYALSEIITKPTPFLREDRKGILGPLMQGTLQKAYSAPKEQWPALFESLWQNIEGKHIQLYFLNEQAQLAAEAINGAGRLIAPTNGQDFLAIVDANLGGAKSNLFTNYDIKQIVSVPENGRLTKTVEITYKNTRRADNCNLEAGQLCLNATLQDWSRLYLPVGSELVSAQGFSNQPEIYEESDFTVIDGFFSLEPLGTAKLVITYTVPYTDLETYRVELWKQGGIPAFTTLLDVNGGEEQVLIEKDTSLEIPF